MGRLKLTGSVFAPLVGVGVILALAHCGSSDTYRHPTSHGCTTVNATAIDAAVVNADATNPNAPSICESVG